METIFIFVSAEDENENNKNKIQIKKYKKEILKVNFIFTFCVTLK